jgi:hypothetical protein
MSNLEKLMKAYEEASKVKEENLHYSFYRKESAEEKERREALEHLLWRNWHDTKNDLARELMRLVQPEHMDEYYAQCFIGDHYYIAKPILLALAAKEDLKSISA